MDAVVRESSSAIDTDPEPDTPPSLDDASTRLAQVPATTDWTHILARILVATGLPVALYTVLRPENFGLTPNSLDPLFYTGYAINFDDILNAASDRHYFVSRWSSYYPAYITNAIAGPVVGRLLLRLVLAALILGSLWQLGRRQRWSWSQRILIGSLVLTMPMFVRAFFTDYVEYTVVALGICLVVVCVQGRATLSSGFLAGSLAAAIVVANPIAITAVVLPLLTFIVIGTTNWRERLSAVGSIVLAGALVVLAGLVLFRWRYDIDNVYQPSIDFMRLYEGRDGFKSPRLDWLWHYTWLFATPVVLCVALGASVRKSIRFERYEIAAFVLCALQYAYQWLDQFVRDGNGLEVSYYWSFSYPTFAVTLALLVGRLTMRVSLSILASILVGWVAFLLVGVPVALRLPAGGWFFIIGALAIGAFIAGLKRRPALAAAGLLLFVGWIQIGAPRYDPTAYFQLNTSPQYDRLYRQSGGLSELVYQEAIWFEEQMDRIPNDASSSFVPVGRWSSSIAGLYAPHVTQRLAEFEVDGGHLTPAAVAEVRSGQRPILAVLGPPDNVQRMIESFPKDLAVGEQQLDATHDSALGYRLVVYTMPDSAILPFTWPADSLPVLSGTVRGRVVSVDPSDVPGIVTFGPYIVLPSGRYEIALRYTSTAAVGTPAGRLEATSLGGPIVATSDFDGTDGRDRLVRLTFDADDVDARWEFRTVWSGRGKLTVKTITLTALSGD